MADALAPSWLDWRRRRRLRDIGGATLLWGAILGFCLWASIAHSNEFTVGVIVGVVLALGAIGLTLIYGILKFGHFAHGDSMMLSAYLAFFALTGVFLGERRDAEAPFAIDMLPGATERIWQFSFGYGLLLAMAAAAAAAIALLLLLERIVYRPLRRRGAGVVILAIASLGIAIALRSLMLMGWGGDPRYYTPGIRQTVDLPWGTRIPADQLFIVGMAALLVVAVYVLLNHTNIGRAMRATADNPDLARVTGIDTDAIIDWTWTVAAVLIAVAGVLLALQSQLNPQLGFALLLPLFAATLLGGIGSPWGALVGGLIVGITQEVAVTVGFLGPGYKFAVAFVILILVVLLRPRGLFGSEQ